MKKHRRKLRKLSAFSKKKTDFTKYIEIPFLADAEFQKFANKHYCATDPPRNIEKEKSGQVQQVLIGHQGKIPLWAKDMELNWRFGENVNNEQKNIIRTALISAIDDWGNAAPITFRENEESWDFEITTKTVNTGHYAETFFPNKNQNEFQIFPTFFSLNVEKQKITLTHEIGHIFGLRHSYAKTDEASNPSEEFGHKNSESIMNDIPNAVLTNEDKSDLIKLYTQVWNGKLTKIGKLTIETFVPYHRKANA